VFNLDGIMRNIEALLRKRDPEDATNILEDLESREKEIDNL